MLENRVPAPRAGIDQLKAKVRRSFITTTVREEYLRSHHTRAPPVGCELGTNGIQFYVVANLVQDIPELYILINFNALLVMLVY